jgi:hypothetical protein
MDVLVQRAIERVLDGLLVLPDDFSLGLTQLNTGCVVDGHRDTVYLIALDVLGDRFTNALCSKPGTEDCVDEGALPNPRLAADKYVGESQLLNLPLVLAVEVGGGVRGTLIPLSWGLTRSALRHSLPAGDSGASELLDDLLGAA